MAVAGLYRRELPSPPAIEFASPEGKKLFAEALGNGTMEGFFKLISYYQTQSEPAYCGLATLAVVLNALAIDPGRKWKGPWRWFDDSMLDCCEPLAKIKAEGITFGKVACLAHCNGAEVEAFRTHESSIDDFRKRVISCTSSEDCHVITSYHRGVFKQKLFLEAIQKGTMENFYRLISYFQTQSEPAYCGLASLSMVLNALAIDPGRKWKGPWRWFDESMLDCCESLETVKSKGISFGKLVSLAHCAGAKVEAFRTNHSNIDEFRKYVMRCSSSDDCHVISSYDRSVLKQTGTGHFSPVGGYHAEKDMALILDVARFKYPPHWVPLNILWDAMSNVDESTGQRRGFMLISRPHREPGQLYTLSCKHESWVGVAKYLMDDVPLLLKSEDVKDIQEVLSVVFMSLPSNFEDFIKWVAEVRRREDIGQTLSMEEKARLAVKEEVLKQVQETGLYKHVSELLLSSKNSCCRNLTSGCEEDLPNIAASVCCHGAQILWGNSASPLVYCCQEACVKCLKANGDKPVTVICGTVVNGGSEEKVDMLVPSSQMNSSCCCAGSINHIWLHPASNDVLTALLLALPQKTWSGIKDVKLLKEIYSLVSTASLPTLLQEEVLHLRRQLHLLKRCQENRIEEDLGEPLS